MERKSIVIDTSVILALANNEADKDITAIEKILLDIKEKKLIGIISSIVISEIFASFYKKRNPRKAAEIEILLEEVGIVTINLDKNIAKKAGIIKANFPISYADAIMVATSILTGSLLVSYDPEILKIKDFGAMKPEEFVKKK